MTARRARSVVFAAMSLATILTTPADARVDLRGRVLSESGDPLAGATVYIYTAGPRTGLSSVCPSCYPDCGKHRTSGAGGAFVVAGLDDSLLFRVLVVAQHHEPRFVDGVDPAAGPLEVRLAPRDLAKADPARQVRGRVLDPEGRPVVGATVEVFEHGRRNWHMFGAVPGSDPLAITDREGTFALAATDSVEHLSFTVRARDLAPQAFEEVPVGSPITSLPLASGGTLTGRVVKDGRPVTGVAVIVAVEDGGFRGFRSDTIATDERGNFRFVNLPAHRDYVLSATMRSLGGAGVTPAVTVTLGDDESTVNAPPLTVTPGRRLAGRVVLTDGAPVPAGTRVLLRRNADLREIPVDADGRFAADGVPPEEISLSVRVRGYRLAAGRLPAGLSTTRNTFAVGMTRDRLDVEIPLEPDPHAPPAAPRP